MAIVSYLRHVIVFVAGVGVLAPAVSSAEVSGPYLAARSAIRANDFAEAARYFTVALVSSPSNESLLEGAIAAQIGRGDIDAAVPIARRLSAMGGGRSQNAELVLLADLLRREDYAQVLADLEAGRQIGPLLDGLVRGWSELGDGRMSEALAGFDTMAASPGLQAFGLYHKALALAVVGDFEGADSIFGAQDGGIRLTRRGAIAYAQILSQLERNEDATEALERVFGADADPQINRLRTALAAGEVVAFDTVRGAADGLAEVFFTISSALQGEAPDTQVLIYSRIAEYLRPDHADAILTTAGILERLGQHELALRAYDRIAPGTDGFLAAEMGRAQALYASDRSGAAIEVLRGLSESHSSFMQVHIALGDLLRREENYLAAAEAYGRAIVLLNEIEPRHWSIFYSRAIAFERAKLWDSAEPDFRKALELSPDQPAVMNYLGYSFLELNTNLDEAMELIERAVALRPDDGYIIDSLAWGYFLLGRYDEALEPMERASLLMPLDPIVTDHLGDVYWSVGRKLEARFQWRRALSFEPEPELAERIRAKLEKGLDDVLADEGSAALDERRK